MYNERDKAMIKGLNKILDDATYPLKKREVLSFHAVMLWVKELEDKIDNDLKPKPGKIDKKARDK